MRDSAKATPIACPLRGAAGWAGVYGRTSLYGRKRSASMPTPLRGLIVPAALTAQRGPGIKSRLIAVCCASVAGNGEGNEYRALLFAFDRHPSAGWDPVASVVGGRHWPPACAGVTVRGVRALLFVLCVDADTMARHRIR